MAQKPRADISVILRAKGWVTALRQAKPTWINYTVTNLLLHWQSSACILAHTTKSKHHCSAVRPHKWKKKLQQSKSKNKLIRQWMGSQASNLHAMMTMRMMSCSKQEIPFCQNLRQTWNIKVKESSLALWVLGALKYSTISDPIRRTETFMMSANENKLHLSSLKLTVMIVR